MEMYILHLYRLHNTCEIIFFHLGPTKLFTKDYTRLDYLHLSDKWVHCQHQAIKEWPRHFVMQHEYKWDLITTRRLVATSHTTQSWIIQSFLDSIKIIEVRGLYVSGFTCLRIIPRHCNHSRRIPFVLLYNFFAEFFLALFIVDPFFLDRLGRLQLYKSLD